MKLWLQQMLLRIFFGIKITKKGPNHHRMTIPAKHRDIAKRAIADLTADAWRNGVEPIIKKNDNITTINYGGKTAEVMVVSEEI